MTTARASRRYHFEAAHWLPGVAETHKCHRIHGHNYEFEITLTGALDPTTGFIMDFWDMDKAVQPLIDAVDHRLLNDIPGLQNPTAELIAAWILEHVRDRLPPDVTLAEVVVWETKDCRATVIA